MLLLLFTYNSHTFWIKDGNHRSSDDINKFKAFLQLKEFSTIMFLVFYIRERDVVVVAAAVAAVIISME